MLRHKGVWFDYDEFNNEHPHLAGGQESHVYEDKNKEFVLKTVNYDFGGYGNSVLEFLENRISNLGKNNKKCTFSSHKCFDTKPDVIAHGSQTAALGALIRYCCLTRDDTSQCATQI